MIFLLKCSYQVLGMMKVILLENKIGKNALEIEMGHSFWDTLLF